MFGLVIPESEAGLDPTNLIAQDAMLIALEDETGYVKLDAAVRVFGNLDSYRVEIHVGWRVNEISSDGAHAVYRVTG